ncbi:ADP-forming succinate--CoA ligase subunit beta [Nitrosovibrio sp. Nv17]|uniref:ADP-forming succinate--CoA ligase subunit beta n=1 Tax=Nitrosovibrio sp. Nv17 TaxID=1855339 RepID=UPI000908E850|nr:ADP-forming succinate--CoA ligase subunit beta [Nitrosovibrio sp. Nv17]SFW33630.1 succinyl-CoA synthetase (ADP-forming) beta subunit [Nitrosovibrio sp. Nv17]
MKIHEYQAKAILRTFGVPVPEGVAVSSVEEAVRGAKALGGGTWAVKAQIHAGGRGKGGGVRVAASFDEVKHFAGKMLGMTLITPQTGTQGRVVRLLLVERGVEIEREFYLALVVDRSSRRACLMASPEGGMDIEEVAMRTPERIRRVFIDPLAGLCASEADSVARGMGIPESALGQARSLLLDLYRVFVGTDATLVEINPLILTGDGRLAALDAKMSFDDNALFRHPEIAALRDIEEEDPVEAEASGHGLSYIPLDGSIGCLVNGAGLAMATMDIIKLYGASPANFLDVGGGATTEKVTEAFKLMLRSSRLKAVLVNIFGGIMKCDVIAAGVVAAAREVGLNVPLVVRLQGTHADLGRKILAESGLPVISADSMADAAQQAVRAAGIPSGEEASPWRS